MFLLLFPKKKTHMHKEEKHKQMLWLHEEGAPRAIPKREKRKENNLICNFPLLIPTAWEELTHSCLIRRVSGAPNQVRHRKLTVHEAQMFNIQPHHLVKSTLSLQCPSVSLAIPKYLTGGVEKCIAKKEVATPQHTFFFLPLFFYL